MVDDLQLPSGHGRPCCICTVACDALTGDPGRWPVHLGNAKDAHVECVNTTLRQFAAMTAELEAMTRAADQQRERAKTAEREVERLRFFVEKLRLVCDAHSATKTSGWLFEEAERLARWP